MSKRIGITLGDCAGIGPEIVDAAIKSGRLSSDGEYHIIGKYPSCSLGQSTPETARAAAAALEEAAIMAQRGEIDAVVTGPIHKAHLYEVGFRFPGQTEFFAARCGVDNFAMILTGKNLTVGLVTTHIPLGQVSGTLKTAEIFRVGLLLADFLKHRLTTEPRIAVAGLNPHAGEAGKMGREEIEIIAPGVEALNQSLLISHVSPVFSGPHSPDTVFHRAIGGEFDAVLCMYHDQGLIPFKLQEFDQGVNVTVGLPFPRTSPDHGTAFDIAGKGLARPDSMIAAINLAVELL
ncbi:MAG TPA: 4-hydroxythreonine-4-phosphate dehydrogenase PdxA [Chthoniobacterales bacterium]|jgi:4-hydroxythreonine-4-phosphate dehydrogenase